MAQRFIVTSDNDGDAASLWCVDADVSGDREAPLATAADGRLRVADDSHAY